MARYEGMDDLLKRVREHLSTAAEPAGDEGVVTKGPVPAAIDDQYERAVDRLNTLLRDAVQFRDALSPSGGKALSHAEIDELLRLLGRVLAELWTCESALQHVAPIE